jgi:serine/threonine-protein kinase RsbW
MPNNLKLYCDTHQLVELRSFLKNFLVRTALPEIEQHQVTLAVEEVCANLIIHSHDCNSNEFIELSVRQNEEGVIFEIKDSGIGFNLLEYKEPELSHVVKAKRKGGLGIILVKKIMDKIEFESSETENTCRLFKNLKPK